MAEPIFPITISAYETPHFTSSASQYRKAFEAAFREACPGQSWYAYDTIIHSRTAVEFIAYHMRNNLYGGIGDGAGKCRATVPASLTTEDVERAIHRAAAHRRAEELAAAEALIVESYADEIRAELEG